MNELININLIKDMQKNEVNLKVGKYIELVDEIYLGSKYSHSWKCVQCGNIFKKRWEHIRKGSFSSICKNCRDINRDYRYKVEVESIDGYKYIKTFNVGDTLDDNSTVKKRALIQIQHLYCGEVYTICPDQFIRKKSRCTKCCGSYENSLEYKYPEIARIIVSDENGNAVNPKLITSGRKDLKCFFKCPKCGEIGSKAKSIGQITSRGFYPCEYCSDGKSIPEKFMGNLLNYLNINYEPEKIFEWAKENRYDFFIPNKNMIIEVHGIQHYEESRFNNKNKKSIEDIIASDEEKKRVALENNIKNYIIIDCRYSTFNWISHNVNKALLPYFNLSSVSYEKIWEKSLNSLVVESWKLWDEGHNILEISEILKIGKSTTAKYLKVGEELKKCSYKAKEEAIKNQQNIDNIRVTYPVVCLNTGVVYKSCADASRQTGISSSSIYYCCKRTTNYSGKLNNENLVWLYKSDYDKLSESEIKSILHNANNFKKKTRAIKVVCTTTGEIFESYTHAGNTYNVSESSISNCCKKIFDFAGEIEVGIKLQWMYYDEYISLSEDEKLELKNKKVKKDSKRKKVICLSTGEIFNSISQASSKYNIARNKITMCCKHKAEYAGICDKTGEYLRWAYIS